MLIVGVRLFYYVYFETRTRGINDYDLGEVHEVEPEIVVTKKGVVDKDKFYLPKSLVERFDGDKVWFSITKEDARITGRINFYSDVSNYLSFFTLANYGN
jgi:hypothetical protein